MRLLVLGGSRFVGRTFVDAALAEGHHVTLFNRGKSAEGGSAASAEHRDGGRIKVVLGDRGVEGDGGLAGLVAEAAASGPWNAVIDMCAYVPGHVELACAALRGVAKHLVFVSTISVYKDKSKGVRITEESPLGEMPEGASTTEMTSAAYGSLKVLCEASAQRAWLGGDSGSGTGAESDGRVVTIVRPGLVVGPNDNTDRFTYWPARAMRGGRMLAPEPKDFPLQVIDVRDLAAFMLTLVRNRTAGVFNATGPAPAPDSGAAYTWAQLADTLVEAATATATATDAAEALTVEWVDSAFLASQGVKPWAGLPMWLEGSGDEGLFSASTDAGAAAGLRTRPLLDTVKDLMAWVGSDTWKAAPRKSDTDAATGRKVPSDDAKAAAAGSDAAAPAIDEGWSVAAGPTEARERELLSAWDSRERAASGGDGTVEGAAKA